MQTLKYGYMTLAWIEQGGQMGKLRNIGRILADAVFPPACPGCGQPLGYKEGAREQICGACASKLIYIHEPRCLKCGKEIEKEEAQYCYDCQKQEHRFVQGTAVYAYTDVVQHSIYRFKYQNKREYAAFYAKEIRKQCGAQMKRWHPDAIVPVPLHISKYRKRGYNQSELIAEILSAILEIPMDNRLLVRSRKTIPMKELNNEERVKNLENAFICTQNVVKYNKVILVDDIYTTGSTMDACAKALMDAGVQEVYYVVLSIGKGF